MPNRITSAETDDDNSIEQMVQSPAKLLTNPMLAAVNVFSPKPTDKICIVVYGNIASGKSTFSKNILSILKGFNYVSLDRIRVDWYDKHPEMNGIARERKCEVDCLNQILKSRLLIYETTAATLFFNRVKPRLRGHFKTFYIYINCPVNECHSRFDNRKRTGHRQIAPPYKNKMPIREMLYHIDAKHYDVKVDLELNSVELSPEQMVEAFSDFFNRR